MPKLKKIEKIISAPPHHWVGDGFKVHTLFPSQEIDKSRMSPFFLFDYNAKTEFPPSDVPRGVDPHPHRGFETVTIAFHGSVAHHDSIGNSGVIHEGDVQWMTAGSGILHKEYHEKSFSEKGGLFQMVQLWVNLPAKYKMSKPKYQALVHDKMGKVRLPNNSGIVNIIAGEYHNIKGPAKTFTPINLFDIRLDKNADVIFELPENYNSAILILDGTITINNFDTVQADQFVLFENEGITVNISATKDSVILLLSGEPINEPIFQYGPFLMNTKKEIIEAFDDFNNGKFGHLE
ncbi:pirin family protein [Candidatus Neomarinimicrobiota bacterium]